VLFIFQVARVRYVSGIQERDRITKENMCFDVENEPLTQSLYATIL
jgi:hypothetical protein